MHCLEARAQFKKLPLASLRVLLLGLRSMGKIFPGIVTFLDKPTNNGSLIMLRSKLGYQ
jgi:hypothetical protein